MPTALEVSKITVAPAATLSEVAAVSLAGAPPPEAKSSTPTRIVAVSVDVQEKNVPSPYMKLRRGIRDGEPGGERGGARVW